LTQTPALNGEIQKLQTCWDKCEDGACTGTCTPNWQCEEWGECTNETSANSILSGGILLGDAHQERKCIDLNKCSKNKIETIKLTKVNFQEASFEAQVEKNFYNQFFLLCFRSFFHLLTISNKENLEILSSIILIYLSWEHLPQ